MNIGDAATENSQKFIEMDYFVLITTFMSSLAIGIYFALFDKHIESLKDYLFGGHKMKVLPIAISLVAR